MAIADSWRRIDAWLGREAPAVAASLGPGASPAVLAAGRELPTALRESMAIHEGQSGELCVFEAYTLLRLDECLAQRSQMLDLRAEFDAEYRAIGSEYWGLEWFPFLDTRSGSFLCVDGASGAIVAFVHDQPDRLVVAPTLDVLLARIADAMEAGDCVVDDVGVWLASPEHALARAIYGE